MDLYLRAPSGKIYSPLPSQHQFHADDSKYRAYIGGVGAGKTLANCIEAFTMAMAWPGSTGLLGRYTFQELQATTWETLCSIVPRELVISEVCSTAKTQMLLRAPDGKVSRIYGRNLSNWKSITSLNLDWYGVDEMTELPSDKTWRQLEARLRGHVGPHRGWGSGTPNGHDWVWKLFVKRGLRGYKVVQAPTSQNIHNPAGYEQNLRRSGSSEWNKRFLDAEFSVWEGQILHQWDEAVHVIERFRIPDHWPRFLSIDPGLADPTAALMFATNESGCVFVTDEFYQSGLTIDEQCAGILRMVGDVRLEWGVIDPSTRDRNEATGKTRLQMYRDGGLPVQEANNNIPAGIALLQQQLAVEPNRENPVTGRLGSPGVFVFSNCENLRGEIPSWCWGNNGKPRDGNEHCIDAWRYGMMRRPHPAPPKAGLKRRPAAEEFWAAIGREATMELPLIGGGRRGVLGGV